MNTLLICTVIAVGLFGLLMFFQLALALGLPWGHAAYGGANRELPSRLRVTSAMGVCIWLIALVLTIRRYLGEGFLFLNAANVGFALWILAAYLAIGVLMNGMSRSTIERNLWTPVSAIALICTVVVNLGAD